MMDVSPLNHRQRHETPWHAHPTGQLYWLQRGMIIIETDTAQWPITPGSVGWIPEHCSHKATILAAVQGFILHFDTADAVEAIADAAQFKYSHAFLLPAIDLTFLMTKDVSDVYV
ncbi:AraC-like ligand binding domain protein [Vibrio ruber DSM 16370]|uniref:AraC-like ligand binding domain protein n=1 Tax=Vibrio ruber (strain DSM 16370 / JCM 11486 / BCRC 17186 / CECT 7878 / LMG 23124 / VR1) TaxID=1123498 RepID=A0A1R4LFA3_VIBR1|nr:AraC family ligand binding domain-containing protein [Vibrio ruber]SJN55220.1 AraC-like ligand binding domain protein [Vibrio ruber DSM 16370]